MDGTVGWPPVVVSAADPRREPAAVRRVRHRPDRNGPRV